MKIEESLGSLFLFEGLSSKILSDILSEIDYETNVYSRGDTICSPNDFKCGISFILSGKCEVSSNHESKSVILNTLEEQDSFGALTLFSSCEEYPTEIKATKKSTVLFIPKESIMFLISKHPDISVNLMRFLSEKISFLNAKIKNMTMGSIESKFASYLLDQAKKLGQNTFVLNLKKCSEVLGVGRASIYRVMSLLKAKGCVSFENKVIIIDDIKKLEEISK